MGHAVYTMSDPRAQVILKKHAKQPGLQKATMEEYNMLCSIELKATPHNSRLAA